MTATLTDLLEPVDTLAQDCLAARERLRAEFARARRIAARWEPRPYPGRARHA